jgi:hypothetical protein
MQFLYVTFMLTCAAVLCFILRLVSRRLDSNPGPIEYWDNRMT